jgi:glucose-6-phosphate isomerase
MKLRGNKLKPIRFDPSDAYLADLGIGESDVNRVAKELESIRDSVVFSNESERFETVFYHEPRRLLLEYQGDRHGSELAKLFKVANRMHATVDRIVVIGIDGIDCGARAFLDGCCQPYWNELSRGARGSKPRIYFNGNNFDNDATQGLLSLLGETEGRPSTSELDAWGLIVVGDCEKTIATLGPFLRAMHINCGGDLSKVQQRLVAITCEQGSLGQQLQRIGCRNFFSFPEFGRHEQCFGFTALTSVGLVPAAMLGINVIELLLGAMGLNDHFEKVSCEDNSVLRFAALNSLLASSPCFCGRIVSPLNHSLESLRGWYQRLLDHGGNHLVGFPDTLASSADQSEFDAAVADPSSRTDRRPDFCTSAGDFTQLILGKTKSLRVPVAYDFVVDECRFDPLVSVGQGIDSILGEPSVSEKVPGLQTTGQTLPDLYRDSAKKLAESLRQIGVATTRLSIPKVDELHIGQLMQMLMISNLIERIWLARFNDRLQPHG